jgi:glyoxylase-like metal-dependent hydrolase (beta-lactamase superfamily II)
LWQDRIFCGDALELGGCGQVENGECDPGRLYDSVMNRLFVLPDETLVFPGHDFHGRTVSTIGEERRCNPFFAARSRDAFLSRYAMNGRQWWRKTSFKIGFNWTW